MLKKKITKSYSDSEEAHYIYIGVIQALTGVKITEQEKKVLSIILAKGELNKEVKSKLNTISSKARIENIISKLRNKKMLLGNKPSSKFFNIDTELTISLINNDRGVK